MWKTRKSEFPKGIATIHRLKDGALGIKFIENDEDYAGQKFKVKEWPSTLNLEVLAGKEWRVGLNRDKNTIVSISPISGIFSANVKEFPSREGEPPIPVENHGKYGTYYTFRVLFEIVEGECKTMTVLYTLPYNFYEDGDSNVGIDKPRSPYYPALVEFLGLTKVANQSMSFSENILPEMQRRVLKNAQKVKIIVKNGYVDALVQDDNVVEETDETWEDESWDNEPDPETTSSTVDFEWDD